MRHQLGSTASSLRLRGTRFISPRASSLLLGATLAAGALLVAPHTPCAWAAPTVGGDENGPKVQIMSPAYQDVLRGRARILVAVKVTQYNPSTIQLFLDDKPASDLLPLSSFASSTFDWDTRKTVDGSHKLSVRVTDTQGFRGWAEVSVYVNNQNVRDTVAPDLNWGNIQPFQQVSGQTQIQLQAKDNFGVKWIIVSLNPLSQSTKQPAQRSWLLSKPPYNFDFDTTKVADGLYAVSARAWDSMEQEGQSKTLTIGVVNSAVNATTVGESLDALKAMAAAQAAKTPAPTTQAKPPKTNYVDPTTPPKPDNHSAGTVKPPTIKAAKPGPSIPEGYTLLTPKGIGALTVPQAPSGADKGRVAAPDAPPVEIANNVIVDKFPPALSASSTSSRLGTTPSTLNEGADAVTTTGNGTLLARASQPGMDTRIEKASAALSAKGTSSDVLAPALSSGVQTDEVKGSEPVFVARLDTPEMAARTGADATSATLSARESEVVSALAPERAPEALASGANQKRIEVARLTLPEAETRGLDVAPVLSSGQTTLATTVTGAPDVNAAAPAKISSVPSLVASNPATRRASGPSKVELRQPHQRNPYVVSKVAPTKIPTTVIAQTPEVAPTTVPQLSQPKAQVDSVVTTHTDAATVKSGPRIATLPKTGTPDGRPVEVTPSATMMHPVITVSPIQVALDKALPAYYQARHMTTIRAVATHYNLPVELVAAANNWTTDMKILPGMKVQLPRQVQLSYNGQKVRGDVASLMAGDSTFTAMRFLFEHTGGTISWDAAKQEVVARKGPSTIRVKIGSKSATVNNKAVMMQLAAFLFEGRTMVPARFFEEGLDAHVEWNPQTGRVVVAMVG